jgi:hypothetical protein
MLLTAVLAAPAPGAENPRPAPVTDGQALFSQADPTLDELMQGFEASDSTEEADPPLDDILKGFESQTGPPESAEDDKAASSSWWEQIFSIDGYAKLGAVYNLHGHRGRGTDIQWRGLSRLRGELQLDVDVRPVPGWRGLFSAKASYDPFYRIDGRDDFTAAVLDNYESELELREVYLQGRLLPSLDVKLGRQIAVWGKSDNIRVTDVLNPLDLREPGLTDIEDLRLPVGMSRLDYYWNLWGRWRLTAIALHEIRFNKNPEFGHDFYFFDSPPPHEVKPDSGGGHTEWAAALSGIFHGWDAALYWADIYDDSPHPVLKGAAVTPRPLPLAPRVELESRQRHARLQMTGAAANLAWGDWLFKAEAAYLHGLKFFEDPRDLNSRLVGLPGDDAARDYDRLDVMAGLDYNGFEETTITVEAVNRHLRHFDEELKMLASAPLKDEFQWVVRITRTFLNETLELTALAATFGALGEDGAYQRFSAVYDLTDTIQLTGGVVLYSSGDLARFRHVGDNDRVYFELKYSF